MLGNKGKIADFVDNDEGFIGVDESFLEQMAKVMKLSAVELKTAIDSGVIDTKRISKAFNAVTGEPESKPEPKKTSFQEALNRKLLDRTGSNLDTAA